MKQTPIRRKTPLRQCSTKRAAAMSTDKRRQATPMRAVAIKTSAKRMRQGRSTGKPTQAQVHRFEHIRAIGCIACLMSGRRFLLVEVHHLNRGGYHGAKRRGHDFTVGLCAWHHQGHPLPHTSTEQMKVSFGPSYKLHKKAFRQRYGTDDDLLTLQNQLIALREAP